MLNKYIELLKYIGKYKNERIKVTLISAFSAGLGAFIPYFTGVLINKIQTGENISIIIKFGLALILFTIFSSSINSFQNYNWHRYYLKYTNYFRVLMLKSGLEKNLSYYKKNPNDFSTKILHDASVISSEIAVGFPVAIVNSIKLIIILILMVNMNARLSVIIFIIVPIYVFVFNHIDEKLQNNSLEERNKFNNLAYTIKEYLDGIFQIKINRKESYFLSKFNNKISEYEKYALNIKKYTAISYGVGRTITTILPIIVLIYGALEVSKGRLNIGYLFAFYSYIGYLYEPLQNLSDWYTQLQITLGMSDRVMEFLKGDKESVASKKISEINSIKVNNLSFSFGNNYILNNINFNLSKGDILGISGSSGSGKTILIEILLKIWGNYSGEILINGIDLKQICKESFYENISVLEQEPFIFEGNISENITLNSTASDYINALNNAELSNFYSKRIDNSNEEIKSKGKNLSGGEKQRICLARTYYRNSDLIILDEFTSALDEITETKIINKLKNIYKDKIVIIITHKKYPLSICNKNLKL